MDTNNTFWYIFPHVPWENGGNSAEQYARTLKENCFFIHRNLREDFCDDVSIIPWKKEKIYSVLQKEMGKQKIAVFEIPIPDFLHYAKICKQMGMKIVYRCVDNWESLPNFSKGLYNSEIEKEFIAIADLSVSSLKIMANKYNIKYLPNACYEICKNPKKTDISNLIIGGVGTIDLGRRFNMDLLKLLAKTFQDVNFVVVGDYKEYVETNIHVYPRLNWKQSYEHIKTFDIGLALYTKEWSLSQCQPIKSWEYMSCGIPQLCTEGVDLPIHNSIFTYNTYAECINTIREILFNICNINKEEIIKFASQNTWEHRIKQIISWLGEK